MKKGRSSAGHTAKHTSSGKHHGGKKHNPTAKQKAAWAKWQHAGNKASVVARHHQHAKPTGWTPGAVACCAAEALAAVLRRTGRPVTDEDVLALYWRTASDPDAGATIEDTIAAAMDYGLAGVRLVDARPAARLGDGVVLAVDLAEPHAVVLDGPGVWSWGEWWPTSPALLGAATEAWELTWP